MALGETVRLIVSGVIVGIVIVFVLYGFYWLLRWLGILRLMGIGKKTEVPDEIYKEVMGKDFNSLNKMIDKIPKKKQELYIQAYLDLKEIDEDEKK